MASCSLEQRSVLKRDTVHGMYHYIFKMTMSSARRERGSHETKTDEDESVGTHFGSSLFGDWRLVNVSTDLEAKSAEPIVYPSGFRIDVILFELGLIDVLLYSLARYMHIYFSLGSTKCN